MAASSAAVRAAAMACILLACTVPLLEFVPLASTAPMAAIALFGLALLVHDGALMVAAFVAAAAAIVFMAIVLA
ncbi:exopolysaccharide biosynthesis protein [Variovorax beijingensis]|nr:exopolysaccharide biosynthesis protein [Variovorax beijingensis]